MRVDRRIAASWILAIPAAAALSLAGCRPERTAAPGSSAVPAAASGSKAATQQGVQKSAGSVAAQGMVAEITKPPTPGSVPYKDAIIAAHLTGVRAISGKVPKEIVVYLWGMRDNRATSASQIQKGERLSLDLKPWDTVESDYGSYNRVELSDPATMSLPPFWGEIR